MFKDSITDENNSTCLQTLSDQFSCCCRIIQYFEKEDPINDDQIESFPEQVAKLKHGSYMTKSKMLKEFADKEFKEETTAILDFVSTGEKTIIEHFVLGGAYEFPPNSEFFFGCMDMKELEYSQISNKVKCQYMRRIGMDFRDCVKALREGQPMGNREEIFKYRFKWLISMTESFFMCLIEKKQSIFFDHTFEYQDIRINVDVRIHKDGLDSVFIMFSHSNMDDAFKSEEFYKMVAFIILASQ